MEPDMTITWTLRADRRTADVPAIRRELEELEATLTGLRLHLLTDAEIDAHFTLEDGPADYSAARLLG
jgi:hypothetical protein